MSQTSKYTPGPWRVSYEHGTTQIRTANNESIMCDETYYPWVPKNDADWHLIAAAPDLLEALEWALDAWDTHNRTGDPMQGDWESDAIAAIVKAKGEQP